MNIQITIWLIFVFASLINSVLDLKTMHISLLENYRCLSFTVFLCVYQKINIIENIISGILLFFIFLATRKLSNKVVNIKEKISIGNFDFANLF